MAGEGPPPTAFLAASYKVVDGAPARTMTQKGRCATRLIRSAKPTGNPAMASGEVAVGEVRVKRQNDRKP
jgi:hypothetical protein